MRQTKDETGPKPNLLCGDRLATDGIGAPGRQHSALDRHANRDLTPLRAKGAPLRGR